MGSDYGLDEAAREPDVDEGTSLLEVLIAVVLLGLTVGAMLTTLTVTIRASTTERDHANAHAWLQSATDLLYQSSRVDCGELPPAPAQQAAVKTAYQATVKLAPNPEGWDPSNINVVGDVLFWNGDIYQSGCWSKAGLNLQLVTIEVKNPNGKLVESVQVVKG